MLSKFSPSISSATLIVSLHLNFNVWKACLCDSVSPSPSSPPTTPWSFPPGHSRRVQYVETEVEFQHPESLGLAGQGEPHQVVQSVVDCPVKLVRLVTSQYQHEPVWGVKIVTGETVEEGGLHHFVLLARKWG